jgi:hypothetical protein
MNEFFCIFVAKLKYNVKPNSFIMKKYLQLALLILVFAGFAKMLVSISSRSRP